MRWSSCPVDQAGRVNVLDAGFRVVGVVAVSDLLRAYRRFLEHSLRRLGSTFRGATLIEERIAEGSGADGIAVSDGRLPNGTNVIAIQRGEQLIFPERATVVIGGDVLSVLAPPGAEPRVRELLGSAKEQQGPEDRQELL
jgi:hypothetical protein